MAKTGNRSDPFTAFRFEVSIDAIAVAGFSDCTGLRLETPMMSYAEGGVNTFQHQLPMPSKQANLVLKRGIVDRLLWNWHWDLVQGRAYPKSGSIKVFDGASDNPSMHWEFREALPTIWDGPALSATQSAVALESLTLVHHGLERVV